MVSKYNFIDKYLVIDTETSIKNVGEDAIGKNKASAFHPDNYIVAMGTFDGDKYDNRYYSEQTRMEDTCVTEIPNLWIGQNIKFDMHHLFNLFKEFQYEIFPHIQIWDTQLAEYLLTGQEHQYASLNQLATKYGGTLKNDIIKAMWDVGVQTEDIDQKLLLPYLKDDVMNTSLVFDKQLQEADRLGMFPLIMSQMGALKCTIEMEYNGMYFNREKALDTVNTIEKELKRITKEFNYIVHTKLCFSEGMTFNPNSSKQVGLILFGGDYKITIKEPVMMEDGSLYTYKTGKRKGEVKTKRVAITLHNKGFSVLIKEKWRTAKGSISTADDVLKEINSEHFTTAPFIDLLLKHRNLTKQLNTYFVGYSSLTWPTDSCIHQGLNHTATATGRLSSSKPNLQNVTNKGD